MECNHSESADFARFEKALKAGRNLCKADRMKAIRSCRTPELLAVSSELKSMRLNVKEHFREILPELIQSADVLKKTTEDQSLTDGEREATKRTWGVYLYAINAVDGFEINQVLKERGQRG